MPTGYTAAVCDGKITRFDKFALSCARAFGALIMMRDDDMDAPIPEAFEPNTKHYDETIAESLALIKRLSEMTEAECCAEQTGEIEREESRRREYGTEREAENARLALMRSKVAAWSPPTPEHDGLKKFMLEQIDISVHTPFSWPPAPMLDAKDWRAAKLTDAAETVARYTKLRNEEVARTEGRNKWLKDLRDSLATPPEPRA